MNYARKADVLGWVCKGFTNRYEVIMKILEIIAFIAFIGISTVDIVYLVYCLIKWIFRR